MRARRAAAVLLGAVFGFLITWGQFSDPTRIRQMLLLDDAYLYVMMASAMAVAFVGIRLLRRSGAVSLIGRVPIRWTTERPEPRHVAGAAIFGAGWAITDSCPAPIAAQLSLGVGWSLATIAGVFAGIELYLRRTERRAAGARAGGEGPLATAGADL